jgi:hypothetical protein
VKKLEIMRVMESVPEDTRINFTYLSHGFSTAFNTSIDKVSIECSPEEKVMMNFMVSDSWDLDQPKTFTTGKLLTLLKSNLIGEDTPIKATKRNDEFQLNNIIVNYAGDSCDVTIQLKEVS